MVDLAAVAEDLKREEGEVKKAGRHVVYKDHLGNETVCYGRLLSRGFSQDEADLMNKNDIRDSAEDLDRNIQWWHSLPGPWMDALIQMSFQLGWPSLSGFKKMLAALARQDGEEAYKQALDSKWYKVDTPERALRVASLFLK